MESENNIQPQSGEDKLKELGKCCLNCAFLCYRNGISTPKVEGKYRVALVKDDFLPVDFGRSESPINPFCNLKLHSKRDVQLISKQNNSPLIRQCSHKCEPFLPYSEYENLSYDQLRDERIRLLNMQNAEASRKSLKLSKLNFVVSFSAMAISCVTAVIAVVLGLVDYNGDKNWQEEQSEGVVGVQEAVKANENGIKLVSDGISKSNLHLDSLRNTANNLESIERTQVQNQQVIIERLTEKVAGLELQLEYLQDKVAIGDEAGDATEK